MKKTLALFVSLVLVLSSMFISGIAVSAAGTDSQLFDFESGRETEFVTYSNCTNDICTENPHSGNYCIVVKPTAPEKYIERSGIAVEKNTDYTISFWYRGFPASTKLRVYLGSEDIEMSLAKGFDAELTGWAYGEFRFNTGDFDTIRMRFLPSANKTIYFDDIKIAKSVPVIENPDNIFPDGSLESGSISDWENVSSVAQISNFNPHSGSYSLRITPKGEGSNYPRIMRTVDVEPNTDYIFSFWYSGNTYTNQIVVRDINNKDLDGASESKISLVEGFTTAQKFYSITFNSGDNTQLKLGFRSVVKSGSDAYDYYIDDICLKKAPAVGSCKFDFETGSETEFVTGSTCTNDICTENPHSGNYCLAVKPTASGKYIERSGIAVEENTDYTVGYWYRGTPSSATIRVYYGSKNSDTDFVMAKTNDIELTEWVYGEIHVNSADSDTIKIRFLPTANKTFYLDDITVKESVAPEEDPDNIFPDGSFESRSLSNWTNASSIAEIGHFNPHSGESCLRVNDGETNSRIERAIEVEPYTDYEFSFWYCGNTAWQQIVIRNADAYDIADKISISTDDSFDPTSNYFTCRFNSGNNTSLKFGFRQCRDRKNEAFFYIDDICLKKAEAKLSATTDGNGTITWDDADVVADNNVALNVAPAAGYKLRDITFAIDSESLINPELNDQQILIPSIEDDLTFVMSTIALKVNGVFTEVSDINTDGSVDIRDLVALKKLSISDKDATGDPSDLDGSNTFDAGDLTMIRQILLSK